jgi:hypothetical protein
MPSNSEHNIVDYPHDDELQPIFVTIPDALRIAGFGRAKMYELLGQGAIVARKCGRRTLIDLRSLRAYLESLPAAQIGSGRRQKAVDASKPSSPTAVASTK